MNDFITRYFSKFARQKFTLNTTRSALDSSDLHIDPSRIQTNWLDENTVELVGETSEIEQAMRRIAPLNQIVANNADKKSSSSSSSSQETFASTLSQSTAGSVKTKENSEFATELTKKSQLSQETFLISDLKWFQTRILFEKKYFQYVTETFKNVSVLLDTQLTRMFFTASKKQEIDTAKQLAFDILGQIMGAEIECDEETLRQMTANEASLSSRLKQAGLCCVVDTKSSARMYTIYATTLEEIEACKNMLAGK